ncbi:MAG: hypothetical protein JSR61_17520 [Proteobacteria bacterium]|nr:hypothetical protein [Pseudomonadota bacterium]
MTSELDDFPSPTGAASSEFNHDPQDSPQTVVTPMAAIEERAAATNETLVSKTSGPQRATGDTSTPLESDAVSSLDGRTLPDTGASEPSKSKRAQGHNKAGRKGKQEGRGKTEPNAKQKTVRTASADKTGDSEQGGTNEPGNAPSADENSAILTYLKGTSVEPSQFAPVTALPPRLASHFASMSMVSAVLATTAAALGTVVRLAGGKDGEDISPALRVAYVNEERALPQTIAPVLQAGYLLEQTEVERWNAEKQNADLLAVADNARRRLYRQTLANAGILGLAGISDSLKPMITAPAHDLPRPRFILRDGKQNEVMRAFEAAEAGVLLIDGRRLPSAAGFGANYDTATACLLNAAAAGRPLELADPRLADCVRMRPVVASLIGPLSTVDIFSLDKAGPATLTATVFVPREKEEPGSGPTADAVSTLAEILDGVRAKAKTVNRPEFTLRLSAPARRTLEQAKTKSARASASALPPLAHYYAAAQDLVRRIAIVLHFLDHAAGAASQLSAEINNDIATRAVEFVEQCVLPAADIVLAVASVAPEVRNARRIISFAQQYASDAFPLLVRRDVIRILQRSMSVAAVDDAIRRLVADGLLTAYNPGSPKGGGQVFEVHPVVFEAKFQLPDLITDPRRATP